MVIEFFTLKLKSTFKIHKFFKLLVLFSALQSIGLHVIGGSYYMSSSMGNDSYTPDQAKNPTTPWKSIERLNLFFSELLPGDSVLFKSGDIFYGSIKIIKGGLPGNPIVISSYGNGNKPVISGFSPLTSWDAVGNGVYQATTQGIDNNVNLVTLNNLPQALGRYPNSDEINGGYLNFERGTLKSITDSQLTSSTNWTGAELVLRKTMHILEHWPITKHEGMTITYQADTTAYKNIYKGYGFFMQKHLQCLDQLGEWYFDTSTRYLQMYFGLANPADYQVKVSTINVLLTDTNYSHLSINNLSFEGANSDAIQIGSIINFTSNIIITNCDINNAGGNGIFETNVRQILVSSCVVKNILNNAIEIENEGGISKDVIIRNNTIKNAGFKAGMGASFGNSYQGITAYSSNTFIENNIVDSIGYIGIAFYYDSARVNSNFISNFCFIKDDGAGIYSWTGPIGGPVYKGREVKNNIINNGIGAAKGTLRLQNTVLGIYMDDGVVGVNITGNSISNSQEAGIYLHNSHEIDVINNTVYNCGNNQVLFVNDSITPTDPLRNITFKKNILVAKDESQLCFNMRSINDDIHLTGLSDSNIYARPVDDGIVFGALTPNLKTRYSLEGWRANYPNKDASSIKSPRTILPYKINSLQSDNIITNGDFENNLSGFSFWSQNSNHKAEWDTAGKISAIGSLKLSFIAPTQSFYVLVSKVVGTITANKNYIFRFTTLGTTPYGIARAYIRTTNSPYSKIIPAQSRSFGTGRTQHEFLFTPLAEENNATIVFEIQQNSGITYIDDVSFYEADITLLDINKQLRYEYNATNTQKLILLDGNYIGVDAGVYEGSILLNPYSAKVLIKDSTSNAVNPSVTSTLHAIADGTIIKCYGENTMVSVKASGGTLPYTGTGSFTASAGVGSLKISVNNPIPSSYTLLYSAIGAVKYTKTYILRFSTVGSIANAFLKVSLRLSNSPWAQITPTQFKYFGTARTDHEFIFINPPTQSTASFLIELLQSSGITYIDNIAFFESTPTGDLISSNLYNGGQFETGISNITSWSATNNHVLSHDLTGKIPNIYYFPVKDAAGFVSCATAKLVQPALPLVAKATNSINRTSLETKVVVSASGGTAPYIGTGTFSNTNTGTNSYTVTDVNGCISITNIKVSSIRFHSIDRQNLTVNNTENRLTIASYPNPSAEGFFTTIFSPFPQLIKVQLISFDGRVVFQTNVKPYKQVLIGEKLPTGIYYLQALQNGKIETIKLIRIK